MTLYQFKTLSQQQQDYVVEQGRFFLFKEEAKYTAVLYKVEDFYVEAYYNSALKTIVSFHPFTSQMRVALYFKWQKN